MIFKYENFVHEAYFVKNKERKKKKRNFYVGSSLVLSCETRIRAPGAGSSTELDTLGSTSSRDGVPRPRLPRPPRARLQALLVPRLFLFCFTQRGRPEGRCRNGKLQLRRQMLSGVVVLMLRLESRSISRCSALRVPPRVAPGGRERRERASRVLPEKTVPCDRELCRPADL